MENKTNSQRAQDLVDRVSTKFQQLAQAVERSRQGQGTPEDTLFILKHMELAQLMAKFKTPSKPPKKA